jgi:hypothetical protein
MTPKSHRSESHFVYSPTFTKPISLKKGQGSHDGLSMEARQEIMKSNPNVMSGGFVLGFATKKRERDSSTT